MVELDYMETENGTWKPSGGTGNSPSAHEVRIHADAVSGTGDGGGLPGAAGDRQTIQALQTGRGTGAQEESGDDAGARMNKRPDREFYGDGGYRRMIDHEDGGGWSLDEIVYNREVTEATEK